MKLPLISNIKPSLKAYIAVSFMLLAFVGLASSEIFAQWQGGFHPNMSNGSYTNVEVRSFVVQVDGKILAVTDTNRLLRINPDGTNDGVVSTLPGDSLETQPDGKILYGLRYTTTSEKRVIRLNADGSVDSSFDCPKDPNFAFGRIVSMAIAPDGDVYIADLVLGQSVRIQRLNSDGSIDAAFNTVLVTGNANSVTTLVETMLVQSDGKLMVAGGLDGSNLAVFDIFRTNLDGTRDDSFVPPNFGTGVIYSVSRQPDGKFIVGGTFTATDGQNSRTGLMRLNADGTIDTSFTVPVNVAGRVSAVLPDGKILTGGALVTQQKMLVRLNSNGSVDTTFDMPGRSYGSLNRMVVLPNGQIYLGGQSLFFGTADRLSLVRLDGSTPDIPFAKYDYDGDRISDFAVFRPSNRLWYIQNGQGFSFFEFGVDTDRPVPADYDGDGKTDIAVWRPDNGTWYWINSSNITFSTMRWGEPGDMPIAANTVWDRKAPFNIYRPSTGTWYRLEGTTYNINVAQHGQPGDIPLHGRYIELETFQTIMAVYRPSTSTFVLKPLQFGAQAMERQWGQPGDTPVCGDFDGDHLTDLAVYRPANGRWEIRLSSITSVTAGSYITTWGVPGDVPVVADYNGDQRDDIAVFRPSTGEWYIRSSTGTNQLGEISVRQFGVNGDRPVPAAYLP